MEDDILMEIVGQDYGMVRMLNAFLEGFGVVARVLYCCTTNTSNLCTSLVAKLVVLLKC